VGIKVGENVKGFGSGGKSKPLPTVGAAVGVRVTRSSPPSPPLTALGKSVMTADGEAEGASVAEVRDSAVPILVGWPLGEADGEALGEDMLPGSMPPATGAADGKADGVLGGLDEGLLEGNNAEGDPVGLLVDEEDGAASGETEGLLVCEDVEKGGTEEGTSVGLSLGLVLGDAKGLLEGDNDGAFVGLPLGLKKGAAEGTSVRLLLGEVVEEDVTLGSSMSSTSLG